jgi:hypothetical protein
MKLPIFKTVGDAFFYVWNHRIQFYYLALPAVVILSVLLALAGPGMSFNINLPGLQIEHANQPSSSAGKGLFWSGAAGLVSFVLVIFIFPLYSVAWHRSYLEPNENVTIRDCYRWRRRHWAFLWATVKISLLMIPIIIAAGLLVTFITPVFPPLAFLLMPILMIFGLIYYSRFSMWLPATAIDNKLSLTEVLILTKGNGWRLAAILVVTSIVTGILNTVTSLIITGAASALSIIGGLTQNLLANLAEFLIFYAGIAIGISALSIAYKSLMDHQQRSVSTP